MATPQNPELLTSFNCITNHDTRILILGSMPGQASLDQAEYYAHPRNSFWLIMEKLISANRDVPYQQRLSILLHHHIALWDVVHRCQRQGSLDAAINDHSIIANDIQSLLIQSPKIEHVFFNGQKAAALFNKIIRPTIKQQLQYTTLPSTSPAHASMTADQKLAAWSCIMDFLEE